MPCPFLSLGPPRTCRPACHLALLRGGRWRTLQHTHAPRYEHGRQVRHRWVEEARPVGRSTPVTQTGGQTAPLGLAQTSCPIHTWPRHTRARRGRKGRLWFGSCKSASCGLLVRPSCGLLVRRGASAGSLVGLQIASAGPNDGAIAKARHGQGTAGTVCCCGTEGPIHTVVPARGGPKSCAARGLLCAAILSCYPILSGYRHRQRGDAR